MLAVTVKATCLTFFLAFAAAELYEGDSCSTNDGTSGVCKLISQCEKAKEDLDNGIYPAFCGFKQQMPIVCCPEPKPVQGDTTGKRKSVRKCEEYSAYAYSKESVIPLLPGYKPQDKDSQCVEGKKLIVGGVEAEPKEFPHMANIGFGEQNSILWGCGGTLISEKFVLTAAHCTKSRDWGAAKWVRLGDLNLKRTDDNAAPQDFKIVNVHRHPGYKPPSHYNDIALLELDRSAQFNGYVRPACLHVDGSEPKKMVATGWGLTDWIGAESSETLLKVGLDSADVALCNDTFGPLIGGRKLRNGITPDTMVCAGDLNGGKDTCKGDSGGPLQVRLTKPDCMYDIVGITSFGTICGSVNSPAVYTRVSYYVPWIETIAWG